MGIEQRSEDHSKWTPEKRLVIDAQKKTGSWAPKETIVDDSLDGDDDGQVVRDAIVAQTKIEEARRRAVELATSRDSGMVALQKKLMEEGARREHEDAVRRAYVPEETSVSASVVGSSRADFNAELSNLAMTGPMELKNGKWVKHIPYAGEAPSDEISEETPRPIVRRRKDGGREDEAEISAK